jgi:poly(3-hydroxybutyrate) depolymerase
VTRYSYTDSAGVTHVESVLVEGLAHAFPIRPGGIPPCGQPSDYVVSAGVCAAQEIARFWGLSDDN